MRRFTLLSLVVLAVAPRTALANQCPAGAPFVANTEVPAGCPIVLYVDPARYGTTLAPRAYVWRNNQEVEVTASVSRSIQMWGVTYYGLDENCVPGSGVTDVPFDAYAFTVTGVTPGEVVFASVTAGGGPVTITAAGPCPAPAVEEHLYCDASVQDYAACEEAQQGSDGDDAGGCAAGGGRTSLAAGLVLLALRRRKR